MAELLEPTGETLPERRTYPWSEWMDGQPRRLRPSDARSAGDFDPDPKNFATYIYAQARRNGLKVALVIEPDDCIVMQAYDPNTRPRPKLPSPYRRLANGQLDRTAPTERATNTSPLREGEACRHCGRKLTPFGRAYGECRKAQDPEYRCV
jgi:hypothetical protein